MRHTSILNVTALGAPRPTNDPFLLCAHHNDAYPAADGEMGPPATLEGRSIGSDFSRKDGWSMYHGKSVPGFPAHPHRGFETVTIVRSGLVDHADSLGALARFGEGDVQWLTAGRGIVHSEMFPLLNEDAGNPLELFQIWLNLPARSKMAESQFKILWAENIPKQIIVDQHGRATEVAYICGQPADDAIGHESDSTAARLVGRKDGFARRRMDCQDGARRQLGTAGHTH